MQVSHRIASAKPLATTAMHERVDALKQQGVAVIDFSIAISHFPAPACVLQAVADALRQPLLPYTAVGGGAGLRAQLAARAGADNGIDAGAGEIVVTNGAKQALYQALYAMTDPGDSVIVLRPYWPAYLATAQLLGLNVVLADLPPRIDAAFLDGLPPARVLIVNNPHNPTGKVCDAAELDAIAAWLARRDCGAIVDESYEKLVFDGSHRSLAARLDWRALGVVTLFSASQSYAMMGWRAGFAVAPAPLARAMEALQGPITAAVPALSQAALGAAFGSGEPRAMLADYRQRRGIALERLGAASWLRVGSPASGPYLWADISALTRDTVQFAETLLARHRVAIMPGDALGMPGWIRMGYIADDTATLRRGLDAIVALGDGMAAARP